MDTFGINPNPRPAQPGPDVTDRPDKGETHARFAALVTGNLRDCTEDVVRAGESQPCDKPAVAFRLDPNFWGAYPVCAHHARADMMSLPDVIAAVRGQIAAEIEGYAEATSDLIDSPNVARPVFVELARIAREGDL